MTEEEKWKIIIKILDLILDQLWKSGHKSNTIQKARRELRRLK